jgi:hypothetical protein
MIERPFILLTQDNCPNCERLKRMLAGPLKGVFDAQIEVIHRQFQAERFMKLVDEYGIQTTPALLKVGGSVLLNTSSLGDVRTFLSERNLHDRGPHAH